MSDLFEEDENEVVEPIEHFDEVEVEIDLNEVQGSGLDARRKLESLLDEKRLREELEDFNDF